MKSLNGFILTLTRSDSKVPHLYIGIQNAYWTFFSSKTPQKIVEDCGYFVSAKEASAMAKDMNSFLKDNTRLDFGDHLLQYKTLCRHHQEDDFRKLAEGCKIGYVDVREFCKKRYSLSVTECDTGSPKISFSEAWVGQWIRKKPGYASKEEALASLHNSVKKMETSLNK